MPWEVGRLLVLQLRPSLLLQPLPPSPVSKGRIDLLFLHFICLLLRGRLQLLLTSTVLGQPFHLSSSSSPSLVLTTQSAYNSLLLISVVFKTFRVFFGLG
jgi:hypothetical protein